MINAIEKEVAELVRTNLIAFFGNAPSHVVEAMTHDILALVTRHAEPK